MNKLSECLLLTEALDVFVFELEEEIVEGDGETRLDDVTTSNCGGGGGGVGCDDPSGVTVTTRSGRLTTPSLSGRFMVLLYMMMIMIMLIKIEVMGHFLMTTLPHLFIYTA
jgi:hypothetical protein